MKVAVAYVDRAFCRDGEAVADPVQLRDVACQLCSASSALPTSNHLSASFALCRSNAAAAVAGNHVAVFGGWQASGLAPLARLQVFNVEQRRWSSHGSSGSGSSKDARASAVDSTGVACSETAQTNGGSADQLGITNGVEALSTYGHTTASPGAAPGPQLAQAAGHAAPCARGQPTLTATTDGGAMLLFGGCAYSAEWLHRRT